MADVWFLFVCDHFGTRPSQTGFPQTVQLSRHQMHRYQHLFPHPWQLPARGTGMKGCPAGMSECPMSWCQPLAGSGQNLPGTRGVKYLQSVEGKHEVFNHYGFGIAHSIVRKCMYMYT